MAAAEGGDVVGETAEDLAGQVPDHDVSKTGARQEGGDVGSWNDSTSGDVREPAEPGPGWARGEGGEGEASARGELFVGRLEPGGERREVVGRVDTDDGIEGAWDGEATGADGGVGDEVGARCARVEIESGRARAKLFAPEVEARAGASTHVEDTISRVQTSGLADREGEGFAGLVVGSGGPEAEVLPTTRAAKQSGRHGEGVALRSGAHAQARLSASGAGAPIRDAMVTAERTADSSSGTPAVA